MQIDDIKCVLPSPDIKNYLTTAMLIQFLDKACVK